MSTEIRNTPWAADLRPPRWLWLLLVCAPLLAIAGFVLYQSTQIVPRIALMPAFSLIEANGNRITSDSLRGSLVIYLFQPAHCQSKCPEFTQTMQQLAAKLNGKTASEPQLHIVTLATKDKVEQNMPANNERPDTSTGHWHLVRTTPEQIASLRQSEELATGNNELKSADVGMMLVDGWGIVRAQYSTGPGAIDQMVDDLESVGLEARNSTGVNRYAYEAVHLFTCHNSVYPTN